MRTLFAALALTAIAAAAPAYAASTPAEILDANKAAMGGAALEGKATAKFQYAYSGQGMTGKAESLDDLKTGRWADTYAIGPATGANGFDGAHAWAKDPSGTVTVQDGGDQRQIAINEGYRRANMWWRADRGGAQIASAGTKTDGGNTYDVLSVTPKDGKAFTAWFDAKTHRLSRIVEVQGSQTATTTLSDYKAVDGVEVAYRTLVNIGDAKYDQTLTVASAAFLPAQPDSVYAMPKVTVSDYSISAASGSTTIPFRLINNHIYADVKVNGKGPYTFIFDTGGVNLVTPATAAALGLKSEGTMQANGAGSGHMEAGLTKVSSLELGDATIKNQVFVVLPLDQMANTEGVAMPGMAGYETFRRFVTRVDYGHGTLTLIDPKTFDAKDAGVAIPITFNGNSIEAQATFNGVSGNFTVDTGTRASLTLNAPFVARNNLRKSAGKGVDAVAGWGVGGPSRAYVARGNVLKLGPFEIKGPVVEYATDKGGAFAQADLAGNIGAGILKRYIVTLDYNHSKMYLKPGAAIADLDTFDRAGLWINEDGHGFKVVDITKGAPAEAAGLKDGDIITAVDGKAAKDIHLYELRERLRNEAPGTVVTFQVKDGSGSKDVKVTLRDLI